MLRRIYEIVVCRYHDISKAVGEYLCEIGNLATK